MACNRESMPDLASAGRSSAGVILRYDLAATQGYLLCNTIQSRMHRNLAVHQHTTATSHRDRHEMQCCILRRNTQPLQAASDKPTSDRVKSPYC
jgi:hypothetical protein